MKQLLSILVVLFSVQTGLAEICPHCGRQRVYVTSYAPTASYAPVTSYQTSSSYLPRQNVALQRAQWMASRGVMRHPPGGFSAGFEGVGVSTGGVAPTCVPNASGVGHTKGTHRAPYPWRLVGDASVVGRDGRTYRCRLWNR